MSLPSSIPMSMPMTIVKASPMQIEDPNPQPEGGLSWGGAAFAQRTNAVSSGGAASQSSSQLRVPQIHGFHPMESNSNNNAITNNNNTTTTMNNNNVALTTTTTITFNANTTSNIGDVNTQQKSVEGSLGSKVHTVSVVTPGFTGTTAAAAAAGESAASSRNPAGTARLSTVSNHSNSQQPNPPAMNAMLRPPASVCGSSQIGSSPPTQPALYARDRCDSYAESVDSVSVSSPGHGAVRPRFESNDSAGLVPLSETNNARPMSSVARRRQEREMERAAEKRFVDFIVARLDDISVIPGDAGPSGPAPPALLDYLTRMLRLTKMNKETLLSSVLYLESLLAKHPSLVITPQNASRLLLVAAMVSSKLVNDVPLSNSFWASISGTFTLEDVNRMEAEFLLFLDFDLAVDPELFDEYMSFADRGLEGAAALLVRTRRQP